MQATMSAVFVMFLSVSAAHAREAQSDSSTKTQAMTPISGIDDAALAGSARASKLIAVTHPLARSKTCWSILTM